ncbi:hypothetical protein [Dactylosporangium sp. CA-092794]|uniref:hypothetical protein n=1 Tax=Dactylosporangium sp. CA-092794 TaxID=3239929 RepID=UPI003D94A9C6
MIGSTVGALGVMAADGLMVAAGLRPPPGWFGGSYWCRAVLVVAGIGGQAAAP